MNRLSDYEHSLGYVLLERHGRVHKIPIERDDREGDVLAHVKALNNLPKTRAVIVWVGNPTP